MIVHAESKWQVMIMTTENRCTLRKKNVSKGKYVHFDRLDDQANNNRDKTCQKHTKGIYKL